MKSLFLLVILSGLLFASPDWYIDRSIQKEPNQWIGYGEDTNLANAILDAKADVSMQMESIISSTMNVTTRNNNDQYSRNTESVNNIESNLKLKDLDIKKQKLENGIWYVAVSYENIPDIEKFVKKIKVQPGKQSEYFRNTELGKDLNRITKVETGTHLYYSNDQNSFGLTLDGIYQPIEIHSSDLFINYQGVHSTSNMVVTGVKGRIVNCNDNLQFQWTTKKKYVSIFAVTPDGQVLILEDNINTKTNLTPFQFSCLKDEERQTLFVMVFSDSELDNSYFRSMQGNETKESYSSIEAKKVKFDKLIEFLDGKDFVSKKFTIKNKG